jgi:hypothetical protein
VTGSFFRPDSVDTPMPALPASAPAALVVKGDPIEVVMAPRKRSRTSIRSGGGGNRTRVTSPSRPGKGPRAGSSSRQATRAGSRCRIGRGGCRRLDRPRGPGTTGKEAGPRHTPNLAARSGVRPGKGLAPPCPGSLSSERTPPGGAYVTRAPHPERVPRRVGPAPRRSGFGSRRPAPRTPGPAPPPSHPR